MGRKKERTWFPLKDNRLMKTYRKFALFVLLSLVERSVIAKLADVAGFVIPEQSRGADQRISPAQPLHTLPLQLLQPMHPQTQTVIVRYKQKPPSPTKCLCGTKISYISN